eukprot:CAMPEP_0185407318 /NCGR_PEP_ID=MMETSP1365-20130426/1234_1 /TAXON_ID=38817 /ORGANISM="Gephyrocapsa oceanica, Strain RCC1303" /LENGTH=125 /DNA_ID=CAMNT_0028009735 /DNA_START=140 /DNA_END=518 /DNA_ORIENTATION=+
MFMYRGSLQHQQLQCRLGLDFELGEGVVGGRVGVAELVVKVLDRLLERLARDLREVDLPLLLLHIPTWSAEHGLDGPGNHRRLPVEDDLGAVRRDKLDRVHGRVLWEERPGGWKLTRLEKRMEAE